MAQKQKLTDAEKFALTDSGKAGAFKRPASKFTDYVTADGSSGFKAESGRYHIYVSLACPWACRTLTVLALKGLQHAISVSVVDPYLRSYKNPKEYIGWDFSEKYSDPLHTDTKSTWDIYKKNDPNYPNKWLSVPIFFDKKTSKIVNNESAMIIEFLNSEFNQFAMNPTLDLAPIALRSTMDDINAWVYPNINDGVYRCGFAASQQAYNEALNNLFSALDKMEALLSKQRYLCGDQLTLSDIRAFTTLIRFDAVYFTHFKCNKQMVKEYPNIWGYTREIYQMAGVAQTVDIAHIKYHYFYSHRFINPYGIVPNGPIIDYNLPHNRRQFISSKL